MPGRQLPVGVREADFVMGDDVLSTLAGEFVHTK